MSARRVFLQLIAATLVLLIVTAGAVAELQIVWGPILGDLQPDSVQITWYTNVPSMGAVEVTDQTVAPGGPLQAHQVRLRGLQPGTRYEYRLVVSTADEKVTSRWRRFTTPTRHLSEFVFCAYGDTRSRPQAHRQVVEAMMTCRPRLILLSGDLVANGHEMQDWHQFFPVIARFSPSIPLYPCLGNHERNADLYYQLLPLPAGGGDHDSEWYVATFGNCQFIVLDSCRKQRLQSRWLKHLLGSPKPKGIDWRIVMFHHPPYSSGPHPPNQAVQEYFCPYLENGEVDLVFCGHNHLYERSLKGALNYLTMGGGGAPIYENANLENPYRQSLHSVLSFAKVEVSPQRLLVTALDTDLQVLDQFTVTP